MSATPTPERTNPFPLEMSTSELARLEPLGNESFFMSDLLADFDYRPPDKPALGVGALLIGARGSGKTALLALIAESAMWTQVVVTATVREGEPLDVTLKEAFVAAGERMTKWLAEVDKDYVDEDEEDWLADFVAANGELGGYELIERVGKEAKERRRGLTLCLDDLHNADADEMERFGETIRVLIRDERVPIYLRAAALGRVRHNLGGKAWRYLLRRRGKGQHLPGADALELNWSFSRRLFPHGGETDLPVTMLLARHMAGSAYLFQLLGHHAWEASGAPDAPIGVADMEQAIEVALPIYEREVCQPTWDERNAVERAVVLAIYSHQKSSESYRRFTKNDLTEHLCGTEGGEHDEEDVKTAIARLELEDVIYEFPSPDGSLGLWDDNGLLPSFLDKQLSAA